MSIFLRNKRGQNTAEYAILIALVIGAAVAMQTYVQRSMQGGVKFAVDKLRKGKTGTMQYEPYYLKSKYDTYTDAYKDTEQMEAKGKVTRIFGSTASPKLMRRDGYQQYTNATGAD